MQGLTAMLMDPLLLALLLILFFIAALVSSHARQQRNTMGLLSLFVLIAGLGILIGSPAVVNRFVDKLESRFTDSPECVIENTSLVVLGGGVDSRIRSVEEIHFMSAGTLARVNEARLLIAAQADLDYPVVLVGGGRAGMSEAEVMREFLQLTQIAQERLLVEVNSLSTFANAQNVARIFEQNEWTKKIRLVTSALHMQRAVGVFAKQGFEICPISVDRQALQNVPKYALLPQTTVLVKFDKLWHEMLGLFYYRLSGKM